MPEKERIAKNDFKASFLEYDDNPNKPVYFWNRTQKLIAWALFVTILCFYFAFYKDDRRVIINPVHGFTRLAVRPGYDLFYNELLDYYYVDVVDEELASRKVFDEVRDGMSEEEKILLAQKLYQIGNLAMVTYPYTAVYSKGESTSMFLGEKMPLIFESVEVRNNETGEFYKYRAQILDPNKEHGLITTIGASFAQAVERKYYKAGNELVLYQKSNSIKIEGSEIKVDWTKLQPPSAAREQIMTYPTAFTAAGTSFPVEPTETGLFYRKHGDRYIPYFVNSYGREMTYEKTDQHFIYVAGDKYLQTIKSAEVSYDQDKGIYKVRMECDTSKEYSTIDTTWAVRDSDSTNDPDANFTMIIMEFELWDNGFFKSFQLWEKWEAKNASISLGSLDLKLEMGADQYYYEEFTYNMQDCDLSRFKFWE